ncbi:MAG: BON domain-containing protein [Gammaproteobacteria bacterium]|nr:BON domain-containing protein [Gammaproteobacteria bacterium]MCY4358694.1 BON domain-containing protein [Gammaproteobacteria bacterium]
MKFKLPMLFLLTLALTSCTAILVETTSEEGIRESPTGRTIGASVEDEVIETKVEVNIKSQEEALRNANIQAVSHNGVVLLVGQVETEALKHRASEIASQASSKIRRIHNELEIAGKTSLLTRSNDAWLATKVRTGLFTNRNVPSGQVRVATENGIVYLMGMISQDQGNLAADVASNITGVQRVVKVFEYVN